jgi:hypothetical protein
MRIVRSRILRIHSFRSSSFDVASSCRIPQWIIEVALIGQIEAALQRLAIEKALSGFEQIVAGEFAADFVEQFTAPERIGTWTPLSSTNKRLAPTPGVSTRARSAARRGNIAGNENDHGEYHGPK